MKHYIAIVEPSGDGKTLWISFAGLPDVMSAADRPEDIVGQAQEALISAVEAGAVPPAALEDGMLPPSDLSEYGNPIFVLIPCELPVIAG